MVFSRRFFYGHGDPAFLPYTAIFSLFLRGFSCRPAEAQGIPAGLAFLPSLIRGTGHPFGVAFLPSGHSPIRATGIRTGTDLPGLIRVALRPFRWPSCRAGWPCYRETAFCVPSIRRARGALRPRVRRSGAFSVRRSCRSGRIGTARLACRPAVGACLASVVPAVVPGVPSCRPSCLACLPAFPIRSAGIVPGLFFLPYMEERHSRIWAQPLIRLRFKRFFLFSFSGVLFPWLFLPIRDGFF